MTTEKPLIRYIHYGLIIACYNSNILHPHIELLTPADSEDNSYIPPQNITLYGKDSITKVRDFLNEILDNINTLENSPK